MGRQGRLSRLFMVVVCSSLFLVILLTCFADFPKRSIKFSSNVGPARVYDIDTFQVKQDRVFESLFVDNAEPVDDREVFKVTTTTTEGPDPPPLDPVVEQRDPKANEDDDDEDDDVDDDDDDGKKRLLDDNQMAAIEKRFHARRDHVKEVCQNMPPRKLKKCEADDVTSSLKHVEGNNLLYCAIEKTGSTFWRRIVHLASGWSNDSSPFSVDPKDVYSKKNSFSNLVNVTYDDLADIFETSESIIFVRDPFARLFSAWLDKFYSTNPYYWGSYGRKIILTERKNADNASRKCGHDVTFPEFVSFVAKHIQRNSCLDVHFSLNYKHCMPCYLPFDYIGKYETLKEDTYFLLEKLNLSSVVKFSDFEKDAVNDVINNGADWVFQKRDETRDCIPFRCGLFRVWKRLQSRGVISKHINLPYKTNREANNITMEEFRDAIAEAHDKSEPNEIAKNRKEVMAEAFGLLPETVKTWMLDALGPDFELFDYDRKPDFLQGNASSMAHLEYITECPYSFEDP